MKMLKIKKKNKDTAQEEVRTQKPHKKVSKQKIITIASLVLAVITHIAVIAAIALSFRYYAIYPSLFGSIVAIVICLLIIADIIFFVGFNHKDLALKVVSCILAIMLLAGGTVGTYFVAKANGIVDSVLDSNENKYETFSGVFVSYDKNNKFESLSDLTNKKVGMLNESSNGLTYLATNILKDEKIDYATVNYNTNAELVQGLIDGDIDAMVITKAYRDLYSAERDENSPFAKYLDNFVDFYSFEKELKIDSNRKAKNLNTDPFTVLLIGYSRTEIGSSVGLADSIIVATVNPQTYTVSMMSIARDSFVPIPCYGGEYDKINSGRSTSRACFIETVEDFLDMDIDYYMELDYMGLVQIVNTIGGVVIDNPVEFELDGIYVPEGHFLADGMQALEFCRERHHMPNGDFDRQQHQKEVIIAIAKKFIESGNVSLALEAMENASDWMSTDLTLNQLTTVFNLLLNTKNYTGLDTFDLVDFQTLRMTGNGGLMYYSYSMHLPLWVYLVYQGSYDESLLHINEALGRYDNFNDQPRAFELSMQNQYVRPAFYSLTYPEKYMFTPDPMPAYWASLDGMTLAEAMAWASENGVTISKINYISMGDPLYDANLEGLIVDQTTRYGSLISEYKSTEVTVMGTGEIDESKIVPNFVGHSYAKAVKWADKYGIPISIDFKSSVEGEVGDVVSQDPAAYTSVEDCGVLEIVVKSGVFDIKFDANGHDVDVPSKIEVETGDDPVKFENLAQDGEYIFEGWFTSASGGDRVYFSDEVSGNDGDTIVLYAHWKKLEKITYQFLDDKGKVIASGSIYPGEVPEKPDAPTRKNYVFDGWSPSVGEIYEDTTYEPTWVEEVEERDCDSSTDGCSFGGEEISTDDEGKDGKLTNCVGRYGKASGTLISCACDIYVYHAPDPEEPVEPPVNPDEPVTE